MQAAERLKAGFSLRLIQGEARTLAKIRYSPKEKAPAQSAGAFNQSIV